MKTHAFRVHKPGPPAAMKWEEVELPKPKAGQVIVRHTAVGFNMVDTYLRSGVYPPRGPMPMGIGNEGAGVVEAVGRGVTRVKAGDRVAYATGMPDSYSEARLIEAHHLTKLPGWIDDETAAAMLLKGRTVEYLFNRTHKLRKGDVILFHAAAGGVGLIACQWAKAVGATLIGTAGTDAKCRLAKRHGAAHVINYAKKDFVKEVMRLTKGEGVDVVYDSVGKTTWAGSIECTKLLGLAVSFGNASGPPPLLDLLKEGQAKSPFIHRAITLNYMTSPELADASARSVIRMIKSGKVRITIDHRYKLREAPKVHRDAAARKTTGQVIMLP